MDRRHDGGTRVIELGVFSFAELTGGPAASDRVRDVIDYGAFAGEVGLDVFGVGEHYTPRFAVPAPAVVLAAVAARTSTITLTSSVSVLTVHDPVRLYEDFAQLDLISGGRAEITAGRSAYSEPFAIFGVPTERYDEVFEEKLDLLLRLRAGAPITWSGRFRSPLEDAAIIPRLERELPVRLGVGGTPSSAQRAGRLGLPMTLALLLGRVTQAKRIADLYRRAAEEAGHARDRLSIGVVGHFFVGATSQQARDTFYPRYRAYVSDGRGVHVDRSTFDAMSAPDGALVVGSPQEIIDKIMLEHELVGLDRFLGQVDLGGLSRADTLRSIELFATEVAPVLRRELG